MLPCSVLFMLRAAFLHIYHSYLSKKKWTHGLLLHVHLTCLPFGGAGMNQFKPNFRYHPFLAIPIFHKIIQHLQELPTIMQFLF